MFGMAQRDLTVVVQSDSGNNNTVGHRNDVLHRPLNGRDAGRNSRRGLHATVDLHEAVNHEVKADRVHVVLDLLRERLVRRVKRRMSMRIDRLDRSTCDVDTVFISGAPQIPFFVQR